MNEEVRGTRNRRKVVGEPVKGRTEHENRTNVKAARLWLK